MRALLSVYLSCVCCFLANKSKEASTCRRETFSFALTVLYVRDRKTRPYLLPSAIVCTRESEREEAASHFNPPGSGKWEMLTRYEPGKWEKAPDRANLTNPI